MKVILINLAMFAVLSCSGEQNFSESSGDSPTSSENADAIPNPEQDAILDEKDITVDDTAVEKVDLLEIEDGLVFGHFDVDTSSQFYAFNDGSTDKHVHEFDDKYNVTGVDILDLQSKGLDAFQAVVAGKPFRIFVVNGKLSPLGHIRINDKQNKVADFQATLNGKNVYSIDNLPDTQSISKMTLAFPKDALMKDGLIASATGCVKKNEPGKNGEYRNGALLVQVADANNYTIDETLGNVTSGLLWELSIFWHLDDCYK